MSFDMAVCPLSVNRKDQTDGLGSLAESLSTGDKRSTLAINLKLRGFLSLDMLVILRTLSAPPMGYILQFCELD
jgi:hypothetical protein